MENVGFKNVCITENAYCQLKKMHIINFKNTAKIISLDAF